MERNGSIQTPNIRSKTTSAGDSLQKIKHGMILSTTNKKKNQTWGE
jgi:hypothetical protein